MKTLLKRLFSKSSKPKESAKPWRTFQSKAKQAEQRGNLQEALEQYKSALAALDSYFLPSRAEEKYYRQKHSELSFQKQRIQQELEKRYL
jgi:hypothetical protein